MNELMAVRSLTMLPVVTLGGDAVAHVKDTLRDGTAGHVTGFTVTRRGLLSGPLRHSLLWPAGYALGPAAVRHRRQTALRGLACATLTGDARHVLGFTVTGRGLLSAPPRQSLPWPAVYALGPDAVMVRDERALLGLPLSAVRGDALRGRLLGARVVTEEGEPVGTVLDVL